VQADVAQRKSIGIQQVPAVFVIGSAGPPAPGVAVTDISQLGQAIPSMQRKSSNASTKKGVTRTCKKKQ